MAGILGKLFGVMGKYKKPVKEYREAYKELHALAETLKEDLETLYEHHMTVASELAKQGRFGGMSLIKSKFLRDEDKYRKKEQGLIPELKVLMSLSKRKFDIAERDFGKMIIPREDEKLEIASVNEFLTDVFEYLSKLGPVDKKQPLRTQLNQLDSQIRELSGIVKEYYLVKKHGNEKKVLQAFNKVALVQKVYDDAIIHYFCPKGHAVNQKNHGAKCACGAKLEELLEYGLSKKQLKRFQREVDFLNSHNDPGSRVIWRRWWRVAQAPEKDVGTGYAKSHINVDIKLFHGPKRNIHLVIV